jgi:two-component system alkaline phosphatase synthesis response regulator PhoP
MTIIVKDSPNATTASDPGKTEQDMSRILVVDDDVNIQAVLRYRLEAAGHTVITAADGAEALERITADDPDAIILDLMMPLVDGIEVLEMMAKDSTLNKIPVLVLTARVDKIDAVQAYGTAVVQKPFSPRDVTERVEELLSQRRTIPAAEL